MNFFQRQRDVRKLSRRLVLLFAVAVVAIVAAVDVVAVFVFGLSKQPASVVLTLLAWVSGLVIVVIGLTSFIRTRMLRNGGGGKVAQSLGGIYVPENTADPRLRRLRNVVEEMAIASGVPVPEIYVLPDETGINAFAAGFSPADAAVAVTHGALERLNRDELQGVIAHEFSHVVNGDMRLNIRLMGTLFGILVLAIIGRLMLNVRGRNPVAAVGLALIILGYVGVFFGRIIKAAVSRQREYLADASAVQFTRQSAGLAGALKKIGGLTEGSKLKDGRAEDVSHMLFGEGFSFSSLFATHPPLVRRIQTLEPTFDPRQLEALSQQWARTPPVGLAEDEALGLAPAGRPVLPPLDARVPVRPADVVASVGSAVTPSSPAHRTAGTILESIPAPFLDRARHPEAVLPLVFGLLLARDPAARANQHAVLAARYGQGLADAAVAESDALAGLHPVLRLPLAELAFPTLRRRPRPAQEAVLACIHALIQADGRIEVFEYCLSRLLHRELYEAMHRTSPWTGRRPPLEVTNRAVATLLAILAQAGAPDPQAAGAAYLAGLGQVLPGEPIPFDPPAAGAVALEGLWPALDGLDGPEKEFLVGGMVTVIGHDGVMTVSEIELLRTVCALLHCPLPPLAQARPEQVVPDQGSRS
ncbi:M48 family metallopeptidase [Actinophytocola sp.]|uniref:M48 family metallopeptidase n=1 Tax=Actinophytocola sp. TaxID=1872138 RepID=UPI002ED9A311